MTEAGAGVVAWGAKIFGDAAAGIFSTGFESVAAGLPKAGAEDVCCSGWAWAGAEPKPAAVPKLILAGAAGSVVDLGGDDGADGCVDAGPNLKPIGVVDTAGVAEGGKRDDAGLEPAVPNIEPPSAGFIPNLIGVSGFHVWFGGGAVVFSGLLARSEDGRLPKIGAAGSCVIRIGAPFLSLLMRSIRLFPEAASDASEDVLDPEMGPAGLARLKRGPSGWGVAMPPLATTLGSLWLTSWVSEASPESSLSSPSASAFSLPLPFAELASERYPNMLPPVWAALGFNPPSSTDRMRLPSAGLEDEPNGLGFGFSVLGASSTMAL